MKSMNALHPIPGASMEEVLDSEHVARDALLAIEGFRV